MQVHIQPPYTCSAIRHCGQHRQHSQQPPAAPPGPRRRCPHRAGVGPSRGSSCCQARPPPSAARCASPRRTQSPPRAPRAARARGPTRRRSGCGTQWHGYRIAGGRVSQIGQVARVSSESKQRLSIECSLTTHAPAPPLPVLPHVPPYASLAAPRHTLTPVACPTGPPSPPPRWGRRRALASPAARRSPPPASGPPCPWRQVGTERPASGAATWSPMPAGVDGRWKRRKEAEGAQKGHRAFGALDETAGSSRLP